MENSENYFREKSFWLDGEYIPNKPLDTDIEADIAIIGGGFTGLSSAYFLKKEDPGLNIVLLEKEVIGFGASGRNGGFSMTLMAENAMELVKFAGSMKAAKKAHLYMRDAVDHVDNMVNKYNLKCDYEKNGLMVMALNPYHVKKMKEYVKTYRELGSDCEYLERDEVKKRFNTDAFYGAYYDKHCAILNPAKLCREMKRVVQDMGVRIFESTPVNSWDENEMVKVHTPGGIVSAKTLVLATNAYSTKIDKNYARKGLPVFTYIALTEALTDKQYDSIGWKGREGIETSLSFINYFRMTADNRIAMGGGEALYFYKDNLDHDKDEHAFKIVERDLLHFFPQLKGIKFTHKWGGPVFMNPDWIPSFGKYGKHKNILYSMAYSGHGVSTANYSGKLISDMYFGREDQLSEFFFRDYKTRFKFEFFLKNSILRYLGYKVITGYMRWRDNRAIKSLEREEERDYYKRIRFSR